MGEYSVYSDLEHVYKIPGMYIGSIIPTTNLLYMFYQGKIFQDHCTTSEGIVRLIIEILTNAGDNAQRSRQYQIDPGQIEAIFTMDTITVKNYGRGVTLQPHHQFSNLLNPEVIFGMLRSSSNYTNDRFGAGLNGIGIKAVNIFSKLFVVQIGDPTTSQEYSQTWRNNMTLKEPYILKPYNGPAYVSISYTLDFARFTKDSYNGQEILHFAWIAASLAACWKVPVHLTYPDGSKEIANYPDPIPYARDAFCRQMRQDLPHENGKDDKKVEPPLLYFKIDSPEGLDYLAEVVLVDTPNAGSFISIVNGMPTMEGGAHIKTLYENFGHPLVEKIKQKVKGEEASELQLGRLVTITHVKANISVLIFVHKINPDFGNGQTKSKISSFPFDLPVPPKIMKALETWSFMSKISEIIDLKYLKKLQETDGKKGRLRPLKHGEVYANEAGGPRSLECCLWCVEGNSAKSYFTKFQKYLPGANDLNSVLPGRGKYLNLINATPKQKYENKEYNNIKEVMGLKEGVDYSIPENCARDLNHGYLMMLGDADHDGQHINGLLLVLLNSWPGLFVSGRIGFCQTPIIRATCAGQYIPIISGSQLVSFLQQTENGRGWTFDYCKGLGTSTDKDIARDAAAPRFIQFYYDPNAQMYLNLAFNRDWVPQKKKWMAQLQELPEQEAQQMPISLYVDQKVGQFSLYNLSRMIPGQDHLKTSIRKILWYLIKKKITVPEKLVGLAGVISKFTIYHHGQVSLEDAIKGLAQDFVGANNLPLVMGKGQFGTRLEGGNDASSSRYLAAAGSWVLPLLFKEADQPLLELVQEDGCDAEPKVLLPVIPIGAVNGGVGIGSGWSTFYPGHHPLKVCEHLIALILGQKPETLSPWYRGHTGLNYIRQKGEKSANQLQFTWTMPDGQVVNIDRVAKQVQPQVPLEQQISHEHTETQQLPALDKFLTTGAKNVFVSQGNFHAQGNMIIVTELPVYTWTLKYYEWLQQLKEEKRITSFKNYSTDAMVKFEILGFQNASPKNLRLQRSVGMSNIHLLDLAGKPVRYETVDDMIRGFYQFRLPYYYKRKNLLLTEMAKKVQQMEWKVLFIQLATSQPPQILVGNKRPRPEIYADMDRYKIPHDIYDKMKLHKLDYEEAMKIEHAKAALLAEAATLQAIAPEQLWIRDIQEFMQQYRIHYKE